MDWMLHFLEDFAAGDELVGWVIPSSSFVAPAPERGRSEDA
jgi:hypothetical protein